MMRWGSMVWLVTGSALVLFGPSAEAKSDVDSQAVPEVGVEELLEAGATKVLNFNRDLDAVASLAKELVRESSESSRPRSREAVASRVCC